MKKEAKFNQINTNAYFQAYQINGNSPLISRHQKKVNNFSNNEFSEICVGDLEKLDFLNVEELISYLRSREPKYNDWTKSSLQSLELALSRVAEKNPQQYAQAAVQFQKLHPRYLLNLLRGLHQGMNNQQRQMSAVKEFAWLEVLNLCQNLTKEYQQILKYQINKDWQELVQEVINLLTIGLTVEELEISPLLCTEVWQIIRHLTEVPDFITPTNDCGYPGEHDTRELLIDAVRIETMHTVMRYALWINRHLQQTPEGLEKLQLGLAVIPEVLQILDKNLQIETQLSVGIRSVYGQWFPWLAILDYQWTAENVSKIFPQEPKYNKLRLAAWESYVTSARVNEQAFELLKEEYHYAIQQLKPEVREKSKYTQSEQGLCQHLMSLYWHGKLDLEQPEGLLTQFFALAPDSLRGYALEVIGRSLHNTQEAIAPSILKRLQLLWEKRIATARNSQQPTLYSSELATFGWWFSSGKFDQSWTVVQLQQVLELVHHVNPDFLVIEKLAQMAVTIPKSAAECLKLMIENDHKSWSIFSWHDATQVILIQAMESNNQAAKQIAKEVINILDKRGHEEFNSLSSSGFSPEFISWMLE